MQDRLKDLNPAVKPAGAATVSTAVFAAGIAAVFPRKIPRSQDTPWTRKKVAAASKRRFWQTQRFIIGVGGAVTCAVSGVPAVAWAGGSVLGLIGIHGLAKRVEPDYENPLELLKYKEEFFENPRKMCERHSPTVVFAEPGTLSFAIERYFLEGSGSLDALVEAFSGCPKATAKSILAHDASVVRLLLEKVPAYVTRPRSLTDLARLYECACFQELVHSCRASKEKGAALGAMSAAIKKALSDAKPAELLKVLGGPYEGSKHLLLAPSPFYEELFPVAATLLRQGLGFSTEVDGRTHVAKRGLLDIVKSTSVLTIARIVERKFLSGDCIRAALAVEADSSRCLSDVLESMSVATHQTECDRVLTVPEAARELYALMMKEVRKLKFRELVASPGMKFCLRNQRAVCVLPDEVLQTVRDLQLDLEKELKELEKVKGEVTKASAAVKEAAATPTATTSASAPAPVQPSASAGEKKLAPWEAMEQFEKSGKAAGDKKLAPWEAIEAAEAEEGKRPARAVAPWEAMEAAEAEERAGAEVAVQAHMDTAAAHAVDHAVQQRLAEEKLTGAKLKEVQAKSAYDKAGQMIEREWERFKARSPALFVMTEVQRRAPQQHAMGYPAQSHIRSVH